VTRLLPAASLASLLAGLASPFLYWHGVLSEDGFKQMLLVCSLAWFALAPLWVARRGRQP
jgi:hypothetical protein